MAAVAKLSKPGLIVTALGEGDCDFVSRYFAPRKGIIEDPGDRVRIAGQVVPYVDGWAEI